MNEQEQRIAIAEACGWKLVDDKLSGRAPKVSDLYETYGNDTIPDYLHDLNAMHEAEERLTFDQQLAFDRFLAEITGAFTWQATAAQRSEAFLRTIGKWKEGA